MADDKEKESKMVSEAKPGIAEQDRVEDSAAYIKRIEGETPARRERDATAHIRRIERQTPDQVH
ncbi:hypothetical protein AVEN_9319-1, partial [Araneus ventricosus]